MNWLNFQASTTRLATIFALMSATLMIAHQVAGKATRDAIFLSYYDVTDLPKMVLLAAILSLLAVVFVSRLLVAYGPWRVIPAAFFASSSLFATNWWYFSIQPQVVAIALYLQMAIFGAVLISGFWSVVNERFDPHTAKSTIARVAAAATLGGVLGGLAAGKIAQVTDVRFMLLVLSVLHCFCGLSVRGIGESRSQNAGNAVQMASGVQLIVSHRYLQLMGVLVVMVGVVGALVDYTFKAAASSHFDTSESLVAFFGQFYAAVGVATFIVQSLLGPRVLRQYGLGITLAVLPMVVIFFGGVHLIAALRLYSLAALRGGQMVLANSFFRSAFELLYTPLPPQIKRPTKAIIDVASDRLGDVLGSGILLLLLALTPTLSNATVIVLAISIAGLTLMSVARLYRGYVEQLATSLKDGAISISEDDVLDATTQRTLAEASPASERELLLNKIREKKYNRVGLEVPENLNEEPLDNNDDKNALALNAAVADLNSSDRGRVRRVLAGSFMDVRLVPFLIPLLADDELAEDIRMELRWKAPNAIGALTDALLDPDLNLRARQRIPSILEVTHNPRSINGLLSGLVDEKFNIRYSSARALARMKERDNEIIINQQTVFDAVEREASVPRDVWRNRGLDSEIDLPVDISSGAGAGDPRLEFSIEHVFTLLSLTFDRDALLLSKQALYSSDRNLRGTALEYLENILPEQVKTKLWPHLD
ncbi:MAG: Npt1/Npt2 family nucleotide transporter [Gammaproteobacteria bacterium]